MILWGDNMKSEKMKKEHKHEKIKKSKKKEHKHMKRDCPCGMK
jgi:hypothetical protein